MNHSARRIPKIIAYALSVFLLLASGSCTKSSRSTQGDATLQPDSSVGDTSVEDLTTLPSYRRCDALNFCTLAEAGCCGSCGELPLETWTAIGGDRYNELHAATCDEATPICQECATLPPNENFVAICEQGVCSKYDARRSFLSSCSDATDCRAIWADCCGCGPRVIAVAENQVTTWRQAVCDPRADCLPCTAVEPTNEVTCDSGHCALLP
ncbi:MAG: hypothetical protein KC609_08005 [Myxococcales bacterium]|nr:hypothetical protein [Myxococcales bacterium]